MKLRTMYVEQSLSSFETPDIGKLQIFTMKV